LRHIRFTKEAESAAGASLARAIAVLGPDAELRHAAALADLPQRDAAIAADALATAGILRPGRPLEFVHPLVRSAIHADVPPAERALAHAAAARLLADEAPAERVATHLLASEPSGDRWAVDILRTAAGSALEGGVPEAAVTYLRRALAEPPPPEARGEVLFELGRAEMGSYDPAAPEHLQQALTANDDPTWQVKVSRLLGVTLLATGHVEESFELLDRAAALASRSDPEAALELEAELLAGGQILYALSADVVGDRLRRHGEIAGTTPGKSKLLAVKAFEAGRTDARMAARLVEQALAGGDLLADRPADSASFYSLALALIYGDRLDLADRCFDEALADARRRGSVFGFVAVSCLRSYAANLRGSVRDAEAEARNAIQADTPHGNPLLPRATACLMDPLIERGELGEAAEALAAAGFESGPVNPVYHGTLAYTRARLRISQGRLREGVDELLTYGEGGAALGYHGTGMVMPWRSTAALALLQTGNREEARRLAKEEVELYRDSGVPRGFGVSLRTLGVIEDGDRGLELLEEAVEVLEQSYARLEHARALAALGAALRRHKRRSDARKPLQQALDLAHRCGATALVNHAREELAATGARPRRIMLTGIDALTASERRVAQMAAEGLSNKEIAQALFVTVKTVETHLGHAYQKLDIASRRELAEVLAQ
jgi:DNA-binding CsgD family transcriptional regulator